MHSLDCDFKYELRTVVLITANKVAEAEAGTSSVHTAMQGYDAYSKQVR